MLHIIFNQNLEIHDEWLSSVFIVKNKITFNSEQDQTPHETYIITNL